MSHPVQYTTVHYSPLQYHSVLLPFNVDLACCSATPVQCFALQYSSHTVLGTYSTVQFPYSVGYNCYIAIRCCCVLRPVLKPPIAGLRPDCDECLEDNLSSFVLSECRHRKVAIIVVPWCHLYPQKAYTNIPCIAPYGT